MAQTRETNLHVILFCSCVVVKLSWQKRELNVDATVAVFGTILSETWRLHQGIGNSNHNTIYCNK
jgi:hypothetical protein